MERPPRTRAPSATFSLKSDKSHASKGSKNKRDTLVETEEEKRRRELHSKADPNVAMNDAQPVAEALKAPTIGSLRDIRHVDAFGNPITEPDLSNPTRPRWERPLDTIRSFEAAIDGDYKRRSPATRPGTSLDNSTTGYNSRRGSYFGGDQYQTRYSHGPSSQIGFQNGGYYGRNPPAEGSGGYGQDSRYGPGPSPGQRRPFDRRQQSDPMVNRYNGGGVYPSPGYQRSRDTVNTGDSHSQSEPWTNNTDPSSENSSIDQMRMGPKHDQPEQYAYNGGSFNQRPIREEAPMESGPGGYPAYYGDNAPPAPPPHHPQHGQGGRPIQQLSSGGGGAYQAGPPPVPGKDASYLQSRPGLQSTPSQKRGSWLKRRFSKNP